MAADIAQDVQTRLQSMMQTPINISDFRGMGKRTAAFTSLIEAVTADSNIDRNPLLLLLREQFPWLEDVESKSYTPLSKPAKTDTGIVICVGRKDIKFVFQFIRTLRVVIRSTLPIEIAYAGDSDLPSFESALKALDSRLDTIDLTKYFNESTAGLQKGGYATKPFALLASRFQKAILVDADVILLQSPDRLFKIHPKLKETGTLFWHGRAYTRNAETSSKRDWVKGLLNGKQPSEMLNQSLFWKYDLSQEMDSGVVCVNKAKASVYMGLVFASWMNTVRTKFVYEHFLGDEETFWLAFELASSPYFFHPTYASIIGSPRDVGRGEKPSMCSVQMLQFSADGKPFWFNGSLRKNKPLFTSHEIAKFTHYIPGAITMEQNPSWYYKGSSIWCAPGAGLVQLGNGKLMAEMVTLAEKVEAEREEIPDY